MQRDVQVREGLTGRMVPAKLLVCERCGHDTWCVYVPEDVGHVHFQCVRCGVCFCDGGCAGGKDKGGVT